MDFCLFFLPLGHYDEPKTLRYEKQLICLKGADVKHRLVRSPLIAGEMRGKPLTADVDLGGVDVSE